MHSASLLPVLFLGLLTTIYAATAPEAGECRIYHNCMFELLRIIKRLRGPNGDICLNGKLMNAAKIQSDPQVLGDTLTHRGPPGYRTLDERLRRARFPINGSDGQVTEIVGAYPLNFDLNTLDNSKGCDPRLVRLFETKVANQDWSNNDETLDVVSNLKNVYAGPAIAFNREEQVMILTLLMSPKRAGEKCFQCTVPKPFDDSDPIDDN